MKSIKFLFMFLAFAGILTITACGDDDDDDNGGGSSNANVTGTWQGEYSGYDAMQSTTVYIRRELILNANGNYTNKIGGRVTSSGDYDEWEEETGTYSVSGGRINYTVKSDKKVDFQSNSLQSSSKANWSEKVEISNGEWITKDATLTTSSSSSENVSFTMKKQ